MGVRRAGQRKGERYGWMEEGRNGGREGKREGGEREKGRGKAKREERSEEGSKEGGRMIGLESLKGRAIKIEREGEVEAGGKWKEETASVRTLNMYTCRLHYPSLLVYVSIGLNQYSNYINMAF